MGQVVTVGLDLAKSVFQVHGVDAAGEVIVRRQIRRSQLLPFFAKQPGCLVGMEACASSHHWARELTALGHEVKLMPAQYVKPYVKRGCWPARSWRASPIPASSALGVTWPRGSASFPDRTPAAARSGSARSARPATATCARCWSSAPWR